MLRGSRSLLPVIRACRSFLAEPVPVQTRNVSGWRPTDLQALFREMERQMEMMDRHFFRSTSLKSLAPRFIPIEGKANDCDSYRVNIDVQGFKPEDIKICLKDGVLKVEAHMDKTGEDGSRVQQSIKREFTLPKQVDVASVKSHLHADGVLTIEAALCGLEQAKKIPIEHCNGDVDKKTKC